MLKSAWWKPKPKYESGGGGSLNRRLEKRADNFSNSLRSYHQLFIGTINNAQEISFPSALQATDVAARRRGLPCFDDLGTQLYEKAAAGDDPEAVALVWQLYQEILGSSVALAAEAAVGQQYKTCWQENEDKMHSLRFELNCRMGEIHKLRQKLGGKEAGLSSCGAGTAGDCGNVKLLFNDRAKPLHITVNKDHISLSEATESEAFRIERSPGIGGGTDCCTPDTNGGDSIMDHTNTPVTLSSPISIPFSSSATIRGSGRVQSAPEQPSSSRYLSSKSLSTFVNRLTRRKVRIYSEVDVVQPMWYPKSGGSVMTNGSVRTRYETGSIARFKVKLNPSTCDTVGQQTKEYRDWAVAKAERKYGELFVPS
ncbi:hypothetical protein CJU90_2735 [Yarrowia sp. C11]|nr:hypothetical protein CKK34_4183 [Yarrowia sp. E02]KAG5369280.1 hypothetical protein CJU90_2735 [Yarrowia sp. C11]